MCGWGPRRPRCPAQTNGDPLRTNSGFWPNLGLRSGAQRFEPATHSPRIIIPCSSDRVLRIRPSRVSPHPKSNCRAGFARTTPATESGISRRTVAVWHSAASTAWPEPSGIRTAPGPLSPGIGIFLRCIQMEHPPAKRISLRALGLQATKWGCTVMEGRPLHPKLILAYRIHINAHFSKTAWVFWPLGYTDCANARGHLVSSFGAGTAGGTIWCLARPGTRGTKIFPRGNQDFSCTLGNARNP